LRVAVQSNAPMTVYIPVGCTIITVAARVVQPILLLFDPAKS